MELGVMITKGIENWQIIQQANNCANISLEGYWTSPVEIANPTVFVRVVNENLGETVIAWSMANMNDKNKWSITIQDIPVGGLYRI